VKTVARALILVTLVAVALAGCDRDERALDANARDLDLATALSEARPAQAPFANLTEIDLAIDGACVRVLIADEDPERIRGLRAVDDLGPYAGMLFVFAGEIEARFTMQDTITALTIGFYDADGETVSTADMTPCPPGTSCPLYAADGPFQYALEVFAGDALPATLVPCTTGVA